MSPDGTEEITCDLPASEKKKNVGGNDRTRDNPRGEPGKGSGLCVFTSIEYDARFKNERRLFDLQSKMTHEAGGGWPQKVDQMLAKYGAGVKYIQHTGGDIQFLRAFMRTGRGVSVTYGGNDPHYPHSINHMVWMPHLSDRWACISDNNYPGDNAFVWMSPEEFVKRWKMNSGGWAVGLINPPPPPPPRN